MGFNIRSLAFDGDDLMAVVRTEWPDGEFGPKLQHDIANYLTFHRWPNFRSMTMKDSTPAAARICSR